MILEVEDATFMRLRLLNGSLEEMMMETAAEREARIAEVDRIVEAELNRRNREAVYAAAVAQATRGAAIILPVIHYADDNQTMRNAERAFEAGCEGVMLIEMRGRDSLIVPVSGSIKRVWPDRLVGLNFLNSLAPRELPCATVDHLDMTWTDGQLTHSADEPWMEARQVQRIVATRPGHLFFCAVAFKYQPEELDPASAARKAAEFGFIPTTSGPATGHAADPAVVAAMRSAIGPDAPLAIASGITPDNAAAYLPSVSHVLVSTGVSASFHEFDPGRLRALTTAAQATSVRCDAPQ
jgi:hypothetical protein